MHRTQQAAFMAVAVVTGLRVSEHSCAFAAPMSFLPFHILCFLRLPSALADGVGANANDYLLAVKVAACFLKRVADEAAAHTHMPIIQTNREAFSVEGHLSIPVCGN